MTWQVGDPVWVRLRGPHYQDRLRAMRLISQAVKPGRWWAVFLNKRESPTFIIGEDQIIRRWGEEGQHA